MDIILHLLTIVLYIHHALNHQITTAANPLTDLPAVDSIVYFSW